MTTWVEQAGAVATKMETLDSVELWSDSAISQSDTAFYKFRAGVQSEGGTDWIGTFSTQSRGLLQGVTTAFLDTEHQGRKLFAGQQLVVEIVKTGSPSDLGGVSVRFTTSKRGGSTVLFEAGSHSEDSELRQWMESIQTQMSDLHWSWSRRKVIIFTADFTQFGVSGNFGLEADWLGC